MNLEESRTCFKRIAQRIEDSIDQFEKITDDPNAFLAANIQDIKNKIDIQREEIIQEIHRASNRMMKKLNKYYQDCIDNLPQLSDLTKSSKDELNKLKVELNEKKDQIETKDTKLNDLIEEMKQCSSKNNIAMSKYEDALKMNVNYSFIPMKFISSDDLFGKLTQTKFPDRFAVSIFKSINTFCHHDSSELFCQDIYDDNQLAFLSDDCEIMIFNIQTGGLMNKFTANQPKDLKWISKTELALAIDKNVEIWHIAGDNNPQFLQKISNNEMECISKLYFNKYKNHLIICLQNGQIQVCNLNRNTNEIVYDLTTANNSYISHIDMNLKGYLVAISTLNYATRSNKQITIWNSNDNYNCVLAFYRNEDFQGIQFTPDDNLVLFSQNSATIYDYLSGDLIKMINLVQNPYMASIKVVYLKFVSKSKFLVCFNDSQAKAKIKLFDMKENSRVIEYEPTVNTIDFIKAVYMFENGDLFFINKSNDSSIYFSVIKLK